MSEWVREGERCRKGAKERKREGERKQSEKKMIKKWLIGGFGSRGEQVKRWKLRWRIED